MTLATEAREAVERMNQKLTRQQEEFSQQIKVTLKARCFDVLMRRIELDQIDENFVVELDEFRFTLIPADPMMQSGIGVLLPCSDCGGEVLLPVNGMGGLGLILVGQDAGQLYCEPCSMLHQESFDPPEGTERTKTSLETFVDALQSVLIDYSLGGASMVEDLRTLLGERDANRAA
jgi:hypothetical protein